TVLADRQANRRMDGDLPLQRDHGGIWESPLDASSLHFDGAGGILWGNHDVFLFRIALLSWHERCEDLGEGDWQHTQQRQPHTEIPPIWEAGRTSGCLHFRYLSDCR